jgi:hypothetical protein
MANSSPSSLPTDLLVRLVSTEGPPLWLDCESTEGDFDDHLAQSDSSEDELSQRPSAQQQQPVRRLQVSALHYLRRSTEHSNSSQSSVSSASSGGYCIVETEL